MLCLTVNISLSVSVCLCNEAKEDDQLTKAAVRSKSISFAFLSSGISLIGE